MPVYEFQCECGKISEGIFKVTDSPESIECPCGNRAKKILSIGAIETDTKVKWMPSASNILTRGYERPIETRTEYRAYLKENNLEPKA